MSGTGPTEKFVQNAGLLRAVQAELCVSAQNSTCVIANP